MCEPAWKASIFGSCFAFAQCLTLLFTPKLADKFGRKWVFKITRIFDCILYTLIVASDNYFVTLGALIGLGVTTPGRLNVGVPYMNEWFPRSKQTMVQVTRLMEQAIVFCFCIAFYWAIGSNASTMVLIGYVMCLVSTILTLPFPESPRFLLSVGKTEEFKKAIDMMARWNGKKVDWSGIDLQG